MDGRQKRRALPDLHCKKWFLPFAFLILTLTSIQFGHVTVTAQSVAPTAFVHTDGTLIRAADGSILTLRGVNFMGYEWGDFDSHTYVDYQNIASLGSNVVRLPIGWAFIEPKPGFYDDSYLSDYVDRDIAWATTLHLYVVLDMHQYEWSNRFDQSGNGMPAWMTEKYPASNQGRLSSITDFWTSSALRSSFQNMWAHVASRYKDNPTVIGYDILNEPPRGNIPLDDFATTVLPTFYETIIAGIREVDKNHIVFYEPPLEAQQLQIKISAGDVVFAPHFYYLALGADYEGPISTLDWALSSQTKGSSVPVWIGEFGTQTDTQHYQSWMKDALGLFGKYNVGWAWWTYWKDDGPSMSLANSNGILKPQLANVLMQSMLPQA